MERGTSTKARAVSGPAALVLLALAGMSEAGAQAFNPDCQAMQLERMQTFAARVGEPDPDRHAGLIAARSQAEDILEQGTSLNRERDTLISQVQSSVRKRLEQDGTLARAQARIDEARASVDHDDLQSVRRAQEAEAAARRVFETTVTRETIADPQVDGVNASTNVFQIRSDQAEAGFMRERLTSEIPDETRTGFAVEAARDFARKHRIDGAASEALALNHAYAQSVAALSVYNALSATGDFTETEAYALPSSYWDSGAGAVLVDAAARSLTGGMALDRVGTAWGGSADAVDLRAGMGPKTRESVNQSMAIGLNDLDRSGKVRREVRRTLGEQGLVRPQAPTGDRNVQRVVPPPPKIQVDVQGGRVAEFAERVGAATAEVGKTLGKMAEQWQLTE